MKKNEISANDFAKAVSEMLQKETFIEMMENDDWDALEDEIYEYAV